MKNSIAGKLIFRMRLRAQLILLILLTALSCMAQEQQSLANVSAITQDSLLVNQYMSAARKRGVSPDSAMSLLSKALVLAKKNDLKKKVGLIWNMMGNRMLQKGDFDNCRLYLDSAFALNEQLNDAELTCVLNTLAARMYQMSTNYAKAAVHYFRALRAIQENDINNPRSVAQLYHSLGGLMISLDEDSLANHYLLLAKQNALEVKPLDSAFLINILMALEQAHEEKDPNVAISYFKDAYATGKDFNSIPLSYSALMNLAINYIKLPNYDSAEHYLQLARLVPAPGGAAVKTEAVAGLLAFLKKDYTVSLTHLQTALSMTNGEDDELLEEIYDVLSKVYAARGEYQKAYEFHKKYMDQHNLHNDDKKKIVSDFMLSFQALDHEKSIMQKQVEISSREAAMKKQRFWIAAMCIVSLLLGIILILAYRNYNHRRSLLSQQMRALLQGQEIERLKAEAEGADSERTRIAYDIHDGVLVRLANVKMNLAGLPPALPELAGSERYQDVLGQLDLATRELRNTAHNLMPEMLLEEGLSQAIFYFCKATAQASGLNIKFQQVGASFPRLQSQVETAIYRIVQGLVQNIVQHAGATTALVQLQYADHLCSITVEDNGKGVPDPRNDDGYGLRSIRNRIKILKGTIDIDSQHGQGTTVYFEFDARPFLNDPVH